MSDNEDEDEGDSDDEDVDEDEENNPGDFNDENKYPKEKSWTKRKYSVAKYVILFQWERKDIAKKVLNNNFNFY